MNAGHTESPLPNLDDLEVEGRRVLVRADLNVPLENGAIADDLRVRASLPTLQKLLERGARLVVCSHLGRPQGKVMEELRLAPVGRRLAELLVTDVLALEEVIGEEVERACASDAEVVVLENLRFEPGEEANDADFAAALAGLAQAYVNDAFGSSHRAHASVVGVPALLPCAAGLLLSREVAELERLLEDPEPPFVAVLGGAKVSDKLGVIRNLLERVDSVVVGGAMAFTLLAAQGHDVGGSRVEHDRLDEIRSTLEEAEARGVDVLVPSDVVAAEGIEEGSPHEVVPLGEIGERMGVDIGPETAGRFGDVIAAARTVLWNGPMGIFEIDDYAAGTKAVARAIAEATSKGAFTVAGGGDSAAALVELGMTDAVSHLSTGGGASLELLEGKELPGVAALRKERN
ncbi:MAG: phosphoglycerate kinase [Actinomycetota bacterium]|nr:phosphoglycerate kinase [Actinomycetota bacterium]MDQ3219017.1 phosphoglycerate kinase [Actinomycetota bacterium]